MGNGTKVPRRVALIDVRDYPRDKYSAYWSIGITGDEAEGFRWHAIIQSYKPIGYRWNGVVHPQWPEGVPVPVYPEAPNIRQSEYLKLDATGKKAVEAAQDKWRAKCAEIFNSNPQPVTLLDDTVGVAATLDEAETAAQTWVLERMGSYALPPEAPANPEGGYVAHVLGPVGLIHEGIAETIRRFRQRVSGWFRGLIYALGYDATLVRNPRLHVIRDAIDGGAGAGLFRIYDGTRPATCGAATNLLAELTFTDPCAGSAVAGVLTFSSITADSSANASGTATWFRNVTSTGTCILDGNVGTSGSDLNLNSTSISVGQEVSVTSYAITEGNP